MHSEGDIETAKNHSSEKSHQRFALEASEMCLEGSLQGKIKNFAPMEGKYSYRPQFFSIFLCFFNFIVFIFVKTNLIKKIELNQRTIN